MSGKKDVLLTLVVGLMVVGNLPADPQAVRNRTSAAVKVVRGISYAGAKADSERHKLDLYLPEGRKDFPVLLFLHGGGFRKGERKDVAALGETFARQGVGVAAAGYRLYPEVKHPGQVEDAARAFTWLRKNIDRYGGSADRLFVGGHSAGALLAALVASDEQYLKTAGTRLQDIKGVVALSGGYRIAEGRKDIFGDEQSRKNASPINHVRAGLPPFFLAYAEKDAPGQERGTRAFADALKAVKATAVVYEAKERDHGSLLRKIQDGDPTARAVLEFIRKHTPAGKAAAANR
jgi:acetyl esterase/lipase